MPSARSGRRSRCAAGPNVVGPWGLLQSFADGLKVFLKETIIPTSANKGLFLIAPIVTFTVALIVWAVMPFQRRRGARRHQCRPALHPRGELARRLRRDRRRLGVQLQISLLLGAPRRGADGQLRSVDRLRADLRRALCGHASTSARSCVAAEGLRPRHRQRLRLQPAAVPDVGGVLHQLDGRDLPHAVRPGRGGERARRRAPDRIFVDELRALLARRICQRHPDVRAQRDPVLGRLAAAGRTGRRST